MAAPRSAKAAGDCEGAGQRFREMGRAKEGGEMMGDEMVAGLEASLYGQIAELRAQVAERDAMIAQLRAQLATVPVNCIRRYYAFTNYDALEANDAEYTTQQFDSDDMQIGMWLESLEDDA